MGFEHSEQNLAPSLFMERHEGQYVVSRESVKSIMASQNGQLEIVKLLLDKGANLDLKNINGLTALECTDYAEIKAILSLKK